MGGVHGQVSHESFELLHHLPDHQHTLEGGREGGREAGSEGMREGGGEGGVRDGGSEGKYGFTLLVLTLSTNCLVTTILAVF